MKKYRIKQIDGVYYPQKLRWFFYNNIKEDTTNGGYNDVRVNFLQRAEEYIREKIIRENHVPYIEFHDYK